jgi:hypothetical protein
MKAKVIRDDLEVSRPVTDGHEDRITIRSIKRNGRMVDVEFWKNGAVLDHPHSWMLVEAGAAEPADDECEQRVARTPEQHAAAQLAYSRIEAKILPKDFALFDAGYIAGYDPVTGNYLPGPNWDEYQKQQEAAEHGAA